MKNNLSKKLFLILVIPCILLSSCTSNDNKETETSAESETEYNPESNFNSSMMEKTEYNMVAESGELQLYIDPKTTEIKLLNVKNGDEWYSNPQNRSGDTKADGDNKDILSSQITLSYTKILDNKEYYANNYTLGISNGRYYFYEIKNGIGIRYAIGEKVTVYYRPKVLSKERFEYLTSKMNEEDRQTISLCYSVLSLDSLTQPAARAAMLSRFPNLKNSDLYILRGTEYEDLEPGPLLSQQIHDIFKKIGYTASDLEKDNKENSTKEIVRKDFTVYVSVEYSIENGNFVAKIPKESIQYDHSNLVLNTVSLLPMFGAGDSSSNGYLFVPDGSGALIHFNNQKYSVPAYIKTVYQDDQTLQNKKTRQKSDVLIHMPVFGMKNGDKSFLAIIEKGDSAASINADVSGKKNNYNYVYSSFALRKSQVVDQSFLNAAGQNVFQNQPFDSDLVLRYIFLGKNDSDYSAMAKCYQDYLKNSGTLSELQAAKQDIPLYIEAIGAVDNKTSVMGIPVNGLKSLTSYEQTTDILKKIKADGMNNVILGYDGAISNGLSNSVCNKLSPINKLGGTAKFKKLLSYVSEQGIPFYPKAQFMYVYKDKLGDGFSATSYASRNLTQIIAKKYDYDIATLYQNDKKFSWIVSANLYQDMIDSFLSSAKKYKLSGLNIGSLSTDINSDFNKKQIVDRNSAKNKIAAALDSISSGGMRIAENSANSYALKNASVVIDVPMYSSKDYLIDKDVPFYQMVVHGYIPYTTGYLNNSEDIATDVLKAAETGSSPGFRITFATNADLKRINQNIYSTCFSDWEKDIQSIYARLNAVLKEVQASTITSHSEIEKNVFETLYSNGKAIIVNYNTTVVKVRNQTIEALSFQLADGENYAS